MKAVIQRCRSAQVIVDGEVVGCIEQGLVAFLGIVIGDDESHALKLAQKISALRIFSDSTGKFVETGVFSADMTVCVENDGPVTIILEVNS
jgi:D-Tyr-tRNAtyr deacylase